MFTQNSTTTTTNYLYDGDNAIETVDQNGSVVAKYAQGQNIDEPLAESVSGATYDYEQDGLGSVSSLTNSTGALSLSYTYDSFGKITASSGSVSNPFRYTGRDFDSETGLYYYRARYYDAATGRFLSEDPIRFESDGDFYTYTGNGPLNWFDPFGLDWIRYTGQTLTLYGGNLGDTSHPLEKCAGTSGLPALQSPKYQHTVGGPVPEGLWRINLGLDPTRMPGLIPLSNGTYATVPGLGVQWIGAGSFDWGTWRARLQKVTVPDNRVNTFYLHNSHKGYTTGCVETCDDLYDKFVQYHDRGVGYIYVDVRYAGNSTNGGTKQ